MASFFGIFYSFFYTSSAEFLARTLFACNRSGARFLQLLESEKTLVFIFIVIKNFFSGGIFKFPSFSEGVSK